MIEVRETFITTVQNKIVWAAVCLRQTYREFVRDLQQITNQYGVPINESRRCRALVFFADTPKSADDIINIQKFQTDRN